MTDKLTMKQVAERIDRSPQTILKYEAEGLINPERDSRGWRLFTEADVELLEKIKEEKIQNSLAGKPLEEVEVDV